MALDIDKLRKLVAIDPADPLSRFALGQKLFASGSRPDGLREAAEHLRFANQKSPDHLATYHILGMTLIELGEKEEARRVLTEGCRLAEGMGEGMGHDLGPAMAALLGKL